MSIETVPPSWRRDLTREIDLIEEVARIHGYEAIPEDVNVPMAVSARTDEDRALAKVRHVLTAAGYDEAMTVSVVESGWSDAFSPWSDEAALRTQTPILRGADHLRRSLIPSLLDARRTNEALSNTQIELFEIARVYLPAAGPLPQEALMLGMTSGGDYRGVKGVIEALAAELDPALELAVRDAKSDLFAPGQASQLVLDGEVVACLGAVSGDARRRFELRGPTTVAEIKVEALIKRARLVPRSKALSAYPPIVRDLNLVVDEKVRWGSVSAVVRATAGSTLEELDYQETYRSDQLGKGKKSFLFRITLRSAEATLTNEEADRLRDQIVAGCAKELGATLRG
jgi:phenylalanyl-tRNA synthetase beta chain